MAHSVSNHVVELLLEWSVECVFGLPGDGINGLVEAFRKRSGEIRYIHCRHEEAAALAACAYAKSPVGSVCASPHRCPARCIC